MKSGEHVDYCNVFEFVENCLYELFFSYFGLRNPPQKFIKSYIITKS